MHICYALPVQDPVTHAIFFVLVHKCLYLHHVGYKYISSASPYTQALYI